MDWLMKEMGCGCMARNYLMPKLFVILDADYQS